MGDLIQRWEWAARAALADRGIGYYAASAALAEVRAYCAATASAPWHAVGTPERWAAEVATSRGRHHRYPAAA
jgi:hypothetical protein